MESLEEKKECRFGSQSSYEGKAGLTPTCNLDSVDSPLTRTQVTSTVKQPAKKIEEIILHLSHMRARYLRVYCITKTNFIKGRGKIGPLLGNRSLRGKNCECVSFLLLL